MALVQISATASAARVKSHRDGLLTVGGMFTIAGTAVIISKNFHPQLVLQSKILTVP